MAENGATTRRGMASELTYTQVTNSAVPRSAAGESYVTLAIPYVPATKDIITQESRARPAETLLPAGVNNILVSSDRGIYFQTKETFLTEKGRIHSSRLETTFTELGAGEIDARSGSTHTNLSFKRDSLPITLVRYHLACYDNTGVRHYWVDFSVSFTRAPVLSPGVTYNASTFVILGTF